MKPQRRLTDDPSLPDLKVIASLVEDGEYEDALSVIAEVKKAHPRNIYLIALGKQVERIITLPGGTPSSYEQREDLVQSIPTLIQRATEAIQSQGQGPSDAYRGQETSIERLKKQYLRQAELYLDQGELESALAEVRRIGIIDPSNRGALELEDRILRRMESQARPKVPPVQKHTVSSPPRHQQRPPEMTGDIFVPKEKTTDVPGVSVEANLGPPSPSPSGRSTRNGRTLLTVLIMLLAAGAGIFFYYSFRPPSPTASPSVPGESSREQAQGENPGGDQEPSESDAGRKPVADQNATVTGTTEALNEDQVTTSPGEEIPQAPTPEVVVPFVEKKPQPKPVIRQQQDSPVVGKQVETRTLPEVPASINADETQRNQTAVVQPPRPASAAVTEISGEGTSNPPVTDASIEKAPRLIKLQKPTYPDSALKAGLSGQVIVQVHIDNAGKPIETRIFRSSNSLFDAAAIESVLRSSFEPAMSKDGAVAAWMNVPVLFRYEDQQR